MSRKIQVIKALYATFSTTINFVSILLLLLEQILLNIHWAYATIFLCSSIHFSLLEHLCLEHISKKIYINYKLHYTVYTNFFCHIPNAKKEQGWEVTWKVNLSGFHIHSHIALLRRVLLPVWLCQLNVWGCSPLRLGPGLLLGRERGITRCIRTPFSHSLLTKKRFPLIRRKAEFAQWWRRMLAVWKERISLFWDKCINIRRQAITCPFMNK